MKPNSQLLRRAFFSQSTLPFMPGQCISPLLGWTLTAALLCGFPEAKVLHGNSPSSCFPPILSLSRATTSGSQVKLPAIAFRSAWICTPVPLALPLLPIMADPLPSPGNPSADIPSALSPSIPMPGPHEDLFPHLLTKPLRSFSKPSHLTPQQGGRRRLSV